MTSKIIKGETMSASNGGTTRARLSLLAGSSLAAATIVLLAGGVVLAPTAALAANDCTPVAPTQTTPGGNGPTADVYACAGSATYTASGITYSSAGALTVNATGAMNVGTPGIELTGNGADSVTFTATGVVTGTAGSVIEVNAVGASATPGAVNISTAGVTGTNVNTVYGINATSTNGAAIVIANPTGNVNVTSATVGALQQSAIRAVTNGAGTINITTGSNVTGRVRGIEAAASGTGALTITASGGVNTNATAGMANIDATTGTGLLSINITGATNTINGNAGAAIRTNAGGNAVINIAADRTITAGATSTGALNLTAAGSTTVNNLGALGSIASNAILIAAGGSFTLNNDGDVNGTVNLTGVTGASTFNNNAEGAWATTGTSAFGPGTATLVNTGTLSTESSATFTGLETLENSGRIQFGSGPSPTQRLSAPGAAFVGSGDSLLKMDANLNGTSQASCTVGAAADCFSLVGGATSGVTKIVLTAAGSISPIASTVVLIDVNGGVSYAGDFVLDATSTDYLPDTIYGGIIPTSGVTGYALLYDETTQRHALTSVIPGQRLEYVAALQEVASIWHTTSDVVTGRQADLQDGGEGGFWMRASGERATRDVDLSIDAGGAVFREVDAYEMETASLVGGFDLAAGDNHVFGFHGGAVRATLERGASTTTDQLDGIVAGVYAGWWSDGLTLDGAVSGNFLKLEHDRSVEEVSSTDVVSIGARAEAGWKFALSETFYVQPLATGAYVRTEIDEVFQPGYDASWDDIASLRAALGLRVGGDLGALGYWITGRAWKEFVGEGALTLESAAEDVVIRDDLAGELQELGVGLSLANDSGTLQGFFAGGAKFADGSDSYNASFGLRVRW